MKSEFVSALAIDPKSAGRAARKLRLPVDGEIGGDIFARLLSCRKVGERLEIRGWAYRPNARLVEAEFVYRGASPRQNFRTGAKVQRPPAFERDLRSTYGGFVGWTDAPNEISRCAVTLRFSDGATARLPIRRAEQAATKRGLLSRLTGILSSKSSASSPIASAWANDGRALAADDLYYALESCNWADGELVVKGWAFRRHGRLVAAKLEAGDGARADIESSLLRPDVGEAFELAPARACGFSGALQGGALDSALLRLSFSDGFGATFELRHPARARKSKPARREAQGARPAAVPDAPSENAAPSTTPADAAASSPVDLARLSDAVVSFNASSAQGRVRAADILAQEADITRIPDLPHPVDIIVYLRSHLDDTIRFLQELERVTPQPHRLIVINDASEDPCVAPYLDDVFRKRPDACALSNQTPMGRSASINRAAAFCESAFAVIDDRLTLPENWLPRLMAPVHSGNAATASVFSNAASYLLFPYRQTTTEAGMFAGIAAADEAVARAAGQAPEAMSGGGGACFATTREAWKALGGLDAERPDGPYPEYDYCRRAAERSLRNAVAPLYVEYRPYPSEPGEDAFAAYACSGRDHETGAEGFRAAALLLFALSQTQKPVCAIDGRQDDVARAYREQALRRHAQADDPILLIGYDDEAKKHKLTCLFRGASSDYALNDILDAESVFSRRQPRKVYLLSSDGFPDIENAGRLITDCLEHAARIVVAMTDYAPLCPSTRLLDNTGRFCELPPEAQCRKCLPANNRAKTRRLSTADWRAQWRPVLARAEKLVFFSNASFIRTAQVFDVDRDRIEFFTMPARDDAPRLRYDANATLRIGVVDDLADHRAVDFIDKLQSAVEKQDPNAEIIILRRTDARSQPPAAFSTVAYTERAISAATLEEHRINIVFHLNMWPAPTSAEIDPFIDMRAPLVTLDFGAPGERVRGYHYGLTAKDNSPENAAAQIFALRSQTQRLKGVTPPNATAAG